MWKFTLNQTIRAIMNPFVKKCFDKFDQHHIIHDLVQFLQYTSKISQYITSEERPFFCLNFSVVCPVKTFFHFQKGETSKANENETFVSFVVLFRTISFQCIHDSYLPCTPYDLLLFPICFIQISPKSDFF